MFFVLSKVLGFLAMPSNLMLALGLAGLVLTFTRLARAGRVLMACSILLFAGFGLLALGKAMIEPLEDRFPPWDASRGAPDGIVVLGGAIDPEPIAARGMPDINEAAERVIVVAELARTYPAARILYSGGSGRLTHSGGAEADVAGALIESFGVAKSRLLLEDQARNTFENAEFARRLADPKPGERWLLVTSGFHMPRAVGAFRKAGFTVEPYPVDYRTAGPQQHLLFKFDDVASGLRRTDTAMHEWVGLLVYWLTGKSTALFPAP